MSTDFKDFLKEIEDEARAEGPEAVKQLQEFHDYFGLAAAIGIAKLLEKFDQTDKAIDTIFEKFDAYLCQGKFDKIDRTLREADVDSLSAQLIVSLLSITLAAKNKLPARAGLFARAEASLIARGEPEQRVKALLKWLE